VPEGALERQAARATEAEAEEAVPEGIVRAQVRPAEALLLRIVFL
jgi:hypothetical protein